MDYDPTPFELRRKRFAEELGDGMAIIVGGREVVRNFDSYYPFRQDSDFYFLTGFPEPDAVAVLNPSHPTEQYVLFVRPHDREREIWDGYRAGVDGAVDTYGADSAYPISDLKRKLREHAVDRSRIYYTLGDDRFDSTVIDLLQTRGDQRVRSGWAIPSVIENPSPTLHEMRLIKSGPEVEWLTEACRISAEAHCEAMRYTRAGLFEYQTQAALEFVFRQLGSPRDGYPSIVGSGPNACILHYHENSRRMEDGDLVLIDAGAEYGQFSADITRTFPVNGTFTAPQRAIYDVVLAAQAAAFELCVPGATLAAQHEAARRTIAAGLVDLGLLPGSVEDSYAMGHDREFFMHGTGHWLGLDVHDAGRYRVDRRPRPLEAGMAFTVEPGVYVDPKRPTVEFALLDYDDEVQRELAYEVGAEEATRRRAAAREKAEKVTHQIPAEFLGIGVRIEDDVLITADGYRNLTDGVPTDPDQIEAICAESSRLPVL
ncbi:MAG: aminopeptidase P N-terminal domain-containing protein [Acidimicrobiia bacterium]|nr:aminopeptidase P N-terminal domain-containing protein [Acidimicrobiia bacterium]